MANEPLQPTRRQPWLPTLWLLLSACGGASSNAWQPPCSTLSDCEAILQHTSDTEVVAIRTGVNHPRHIAIIGDGIAGTAVALNLHEKAPRVYGRPSFWLTLEGVPEVWQTTVKDVFDNAGLPVPAAPATGSRIPRELMILANLQGLIKASAAYVSAGPALVSRNNGSWTISGGAGRETIDGPLIVATGVLRQQDIADRLEGGAAVRPSLSSQGRILSGDEFLMMSSPPVNGVIVGILGAGGSAADVLRSAVRNNAAEIVVWGAIDPALSKSKAFRDVIDSLGTKVCHISQNATTIALQYDTIVINNTSAPFCANTSHHGQRAPAVQLLVESMGRDQARPPMVVEDAANGDAITYHPVTDPNDGILIGIRVSFGESSEESKPMFLTGAAATWIPPSIRISNDDRQKYVTALRKTLTLANTPTAESETIGTEGEHPGPGFAVAALMGSRLARYIDQTNRP